MVIFNINYPTFVNISMLIVLAVYFVHIQYRLYNNYNKNSAINVLIYVMEQTDRNKGGKIMYY